MIGRFLSIPSVKEIMECAFRLQDTQKEFMNELLEAVGDVGRETNCRSQMRVKILQIGIKIVNTSIEMIKLNKSIKTIIRLKPVFFTCRTP